MNKFRVIQGCPVNKLIAPYIALLAKETDATINSLYRGNDARAILHRHGKHSQTELYEMYLQGHGNPANPSGRSTHELRSDGVAYAGPVGRKLEDWQQGIDVNDDDVKKMIVAAERHGWELFQPYRSGSEFHHINFRRRPKPRNRRERLKIIMLRARLPRK